MHWMKLEFKNYQKSLKPAIDVKLSYASKGN